jgi:hypothetical protein
VETSPHKAKRLRSHAHHRAKLASDPAYAELHARLTKGRYQSGPVLSGAHNRKGFVYFVQSDRGGPIKIGWASHVEGRLVAMQAHCPFRLVVLAAACGSMGDEIELHYEFAHLHSHGEWFRPESDLLTRIALAKVGVLRGDLQDCGDVVQP